MLVWLGQVRRLHHQGIALPVAAESPIYWCGFSRRRRPGRIGSKDPLQYLGDARGHWEGNTLVVETTNLTDQTSIGANGNGLRHSADMKIVERFTRTEADVLKDEVTVDDPKTYTRPFTITIPLLSPPGFQLLPYECHEGNYMLAAVLGGERAEDKALEEDAKKGIIRPRKGVQQGLDAGARPQPGSQGGEGGPPAR